MPLRRPTTAELDAVVVRCREWSAWLDDAHPPDDPPETPDRAQLAPVVRTVLGELAARHPGRALELRVPPFGAVQCGVAGTSVSHSRGTPPNVVETDARTLLQLAAGRTDFATARAGGRISASGHAADLSGWLPLH